MKTVKLEIVRNLASRFSSFIVEQTMEDGFQYRYGVPKHNEEFIWYLLNEGAKQYGLNVNGDVAE